MHELFEIFGGGFVSQSSYESDVIKLDNNASWGQLRWKGRQDPGARVDIRTRTGTDPQPNLFWESELREGLKNSNGPALANVQIGSQIPAPVHYQQRFGLIKIDAFPLVNWLPVLRQSLLHSSRVRDTLEAPPPST